MKQPESEQLGFFCAESETSPQEISGEPEILKQGELWQIGPHRILCGDARDVDEVRNLCGEMKVNYIFTSMPYGIALPYEKEQTFDELVDLIRRVIATLNYITPEDSYATFNFADIFKPGSGKFTLMDRYYDDAFKEIGWTLRSPRIWLKPFARLALSYAISTTMPLREYEHIHTWRKGKGKEILRDHSISARGVWKLFGNDATINDWSKFDFTTPKGIHPAAFPVALPIIGLRCYTDEGNVVYDPCAGSLTTMFACHYLKRVFLGVEIVPQYIQRGLDLWTDFTGEDPIRLNDGAGWEEVKNEFKIQ